MAITFEKYPGNGVGDLHTPLVYHGNYKDVSDVILITLAKNLFASWRTKSEITNFHKGWGVTAPQIMLSLNCQIQTFSQNTNQIQTKFQDFSEKDCNTD